VAEWLDIMPEIPLARGVPLVWDGVRCICTHAFPNGSGEVEVRHPNSTRTQHVVSPRQVRVDLGDPLGFAYGLRYVTRHHCDPSVLRNREIGPERWLHDEPCDDERLDLARTLQGVNHAKALKEISQ
jgi:hypothetical protein